MKTNSCLYITACRSKSDRLLELFLMEIIWEWPGEHPVTVKEVHEAALARRPLAYTSVLSTMTNLVKKGALRVEGAFRSPLLACVYPRGVRGAGLRPSHGPADEGPLIAGDPPSGRFPRGGGPPTPRGPARSDPAPAKQGPVAWAALPIQVRAIPHGSGLDLAGTVAPYSGRLCPL